MKAPRNFAAELSALKAKERQLRTKRVADLGALVIQTGAADAFSLDVLAGVLLSAVEEMAQPNNAGAGYAEKGRAFFQPASTRKPSKAAAIVRPAIRAVPGDAA